MIAENRIVQIQLRLSSLRNRLLAHPLYEQIDSLERLQLFMQHHAFAVWDFMSLLKTLQQRLCGGGVPWLPPASPLAARLVNEIVLGEESDEDGEGGYASHFELYHRAMRRCGADTRKIDSFLQLLRGGQCVEAALAGCDAPRPVRQFVRGTFDVIDGGELCAAAAAFFFGREDLLPDVFQRIVEELNVQCGGELEDFRYYLHRHIELDGDRHGPMAAEMIGVLCGDDDVKWRIAEDAATRSLQARRALWDGMLQAMQAVAI